MTNSESIFQFGNNAYGKPATALNILRESIMGRELFDYAFKEYCRRWAFKHPTPEDFFRTMEDASGVDLDWFWRGWFYGVDHCDMALESVKLFQLNTHNPTVEKAKDQAKKDQSPQDISLLRDKEEGLPVQVDGDPDMRDFYTTYNPNKPTLLDQKDYEAYLKTLSENERKLLESNSYYYELTFKNVGGLVMPIFIRFVFEDGTDRLVRIPAEIWKMSETTVSKVFAFEKPVGSIVLDPYLETADVDLNNNNWPPQIQPTRFELFKQQQGWKQENPMQRAIKEKEMDSKK